MTDTKPQLSRKSPSDFFYSAVAFLLPILLLGVAFTYLHKSVIEDDAVKAFTQRYSDFNGTIFNGASNEASDSMKIRTLISSDNNKLKTEGVRSLLAYHFDLLFMVITALGWSSRKAFTYVLFIRIGLAGFTANHLVRKHIAVKGSMSLVLSTAYALSAPILAGSSNPLILNLAILLPLLLSVIDAIVRYPSLKNRIWMIICVALIPACGISAIFPGIVTIVSGGIVIVTAASSKSRKWRDYMNIFFNSILGFGISAIIIAPSIFLSGELFSISDVFEGSVVRFKLLDVISTLFDGRIITTSSVTGIPQMSVGIIILFLYVLFLINERIPFKIKLTSLLTFLILYLSISCSIVDEFISLYGVSDIGIYSRIIAFAALILMFAAISLRNLVTLSVNSFYIAVGSLLSVEIIHKATCDEVGPSAFALLFSAFVIIVCGCAFKFLFYKPNHPAKSVIASILVALIFINLTYSLGPSDISNDFLTNNISNDEDDGFLHFENEEYFPIFKTDKEDEFMFLTSDISEHVENRRLPELINIISQAALADEVFHKEETSNVNNLGFTDMGEGYFAAEDNAEQSLITLRAENKDLSRRYFVFSGYSYEQNLSVLCGQDVNYKLYMSSFIGEIVPNTKDFNLRLSVSLANENFEFSLWSYDEEAVSRLSRSVKTFNNNQIDLSEISLMKYPGVKTVITSEDYDSNIIATADNGVRLRTLDLAGKLAIVIDNPEGVNKINLKVSTTDILVGIIVTSVCIIATLLLCIYLYIIEKGKNGGKVNAEQKDN